MFTPGKEGCPDVVGQGGRENESQAEKTFHGDKITGKGGIASVSVRDQCEGVQIGLCPTGLLCRTVQAVINVLWYPHRYHCILLDIQV